MTSLFDPIRLGDIAAPNRILMAPLTRGRSTPDGVPDVALKSAYYSQRASAGLIISEGTGISREGLGWPDAPGIWSAEQVEAWKSITQAVHDAGGRIVCQLWHMGRLVHPDFLDGAAPVSSSATTAPYKAHTYGGKKPYEAARAMTRDDIARTTDDYVAAARNALAAGFDGVQLHGANGYLIDQFLRDKANFRDDDYGGPVENRLRLLVDVMQALIFEVGAGRTSLRLSPNGDTQGVDDSNPVALFTAAAAALEPLSIAFLELREVKPEGRFGTTDVPRVSPRIRPVFTGPLVLNQEYDLDKAQADIDAGLADAISFGRKFIANPDLPRRLGEGVKLAPDDIATWYSRGAKGYTDYPAAEAVAA